MQHYLYGTRKHRKDRNSRMCNNDKSANHRDLKLEFGFRYGIIVFNPKFIGRGLAQISMIREIIIRLVNGIQARFIFPEQFANPYILRVIF
jgi:hypothetical protein